MSFLSIPTALRSVVLACLGLASLASAAPDFGFELDMVGNLPSNWSVESADAVLVTSSEGSEFQIYSELGITVEPNLGTQMLRLGTPKERNQNQNRGVNQISQTFAAANAQISFALRLVSLEHRGDDQLRIDLTDASTGQSFPVTGQDSDPFTLTFARGTPQTCAATPCVLTIDVGKRNDHLDSDWQRVTITGLPTDGRELTITIAVEGGQNEALASWAYIDGVNTAPQAVMNFNPGSQPGTVAVESDYIVFDCLDSSDVDGDDFTCNWTASGAGLASTTAVGKTAVFAFPDQGNASVTLVVDDGETTSTTSTGDGQTASLTIDNAAPLVNALNVEVLTGSSVELLCRFADPGAGDTHTASLTVSAPLGDEILLEENVAAFSSGVVRSTLDAATLQPGSYPAQCTVWDDDGLSGSDNFVVNVIDPLSFAATVASNTGSTIGAPMQHADASFIGGLATPESIAVYELRLPNGGPIPIGAEVNISVAVPVDFDAVLMSGSTTGGPSVAPWVSAPWVSAPWVSAPWVNVPFVSLPFVSLPWVSLPFVSAPWVSAPWVSAPWISAPLETSPWVNAGYEYQQLPLSQVGLAAPDGSQISGIDMSFDDLGALSPGSLVNEPVRVKALSAEFGNDPERMLVKIGPGEQGLFLAIIPQQGAFSSAPFSVQVEASLPPPAEQLLGGQCVGESLVHAATTAASVLLDNGAPQSIVITQRERMMATFDMDLAEYEAWFASLVPYFEQVAAKVISVPSSWYDTADQNPCVVAEQNNVAVQIRDLIQQELSAANGAVEYVQLMGSLDIVPPFYTPDETQTGYEGLYTSDLWTKPGTPLSVAIAEGNNITDAFYVDAEAQPFRGRSLFTEDISVSRMVERPAEIAANAARFVATGGIITLTATQSTGYDFFIDGTDRINEVLAGLPVPNTTRNDNLWNVADLRCQFFGQGEGCSVSELNAVNAHMSYNGGVTAAGFFSGANSEVFASTESADLLFSGVTFSIGCHSGLSVPDAWALPDDVGLPLNPARDWVQELGAWVGSYNFAYGDSEVSDRGTEGIMPLVIEYFTQGETLGNALIKAKWQYGTGLYEFGVYDEKSMIALSLFGMPQARLGAVAPSTPPQTGNAIGDATTNMGTTEINVEEEGTASLYTAELDQQETDQGTWYTLNGNAQGTVGRVLQPSFSPFQIRRVAPGETTVHAVALRGGSYVEYLQQDPVLPVQEHDWVQSISEPTTCVNTMTPTQIAAVTRFDTPDAILQTLIVQPGQFECTLAPQDRNELAVEGTFRIWDTADIELLHPLEPSQDVDLEPPVATQQDLLADPLSGVVTATLDATDNLGMREIVALVYTDLDGIAGGPGQVVSYSTGDITGVAGPHTLILPDAYQSRLAFQYIDVAGNMLAKTLKGALLRGIEVSIATSVFSSQGATTIAVEVENFTALSAPYLSIDFGDGSEVLVLELVNADGSYDSSVEVLADGSAIITVVHSYAGYVGDTVNVFTQIRAAGAQGSDTAELFACSDPLGDALLSAGDIVSCGVGVDGSNLYVDLFVAGSISADVSYRLRIGATNQKIQYSAGAVNGPNRLKPQVTPIGDNGLRFSFNSSRAGWTGSGPFSFELTTQDGVAGEAGVGTLDETELYTFEPQ